MANFRRLTVHPPLTEPEFAGFCAANLGLKIDREPSGVITIGRKRKRRSYEHNDWVLLRIKLRVNKRPSVRTEFRHLAQDTETLQALEALEGRLFREWETSEGAHAAALNVAIRALISHADVLESLIAHELGAAPKATSRDMDTYDQRRRLLTSANQPIEKAFGRPLGDTAKRNLAGLVASASKGASSQYPQSAVTHGDNTAPSVRNRMHIGAVSRNAKESRRK